MRRTSNTILMNTINMMQTIFVMMIVVVITIIITPNL